MTQQHTPKCSERVTQDNWNMRSCSKPVKAVEGGKAYCAVHLPSYVKQKADARARKPRVFLAVAFLRPGVRGNTRPFGGILWAVFLRLQAPGHLPAWVTSP